MSLVEAAHLIPFGLSRNDKPTNGVARCPNHHWAMDRHLSAPCPDAKGRAGAWRVNDQQLDDRIEGQRDLVALAGKPVIPRRTGDVADPRAGCGSQVFWSPSTPKSASRSPTKKKAEDAELIETPAQQPMIGSHLPC